MTRHSASRILARAASAPLLALAIFLAGCGGGKVVQPADRSASSDTVPLPTADLSTPEAVVRHVARSASLLDWRLHALALSDDFQFVFSNTDSAGNDYRGRALTRNDEILIARNMFETGTPLLPALSRLSMSLGPEPLVSLPDTRPGKDPRVHRMISANMVIAVDNGVSSYRITGAGRFFLVRGDSAQIPPDLVVSRFGPDPSRWWLERWEDETFSGEGAAARAAMPAQSMTWGALKVLYR